MYTVCIIDVRMNLFRYVVKNWEIKRKNYAATIRVLRQSLVGSFMQIIQTIYFFLVNICPAHSSNHNRDLQSER